MGCIETREKTGTQEVREMTLKHMFRGDRVTQSLRVALQVQLC